MTYAEITAMLQQIGRIVWGPPTWALLGLCGLYLSVRTGWFQVSRFGAYYSSTVGKIFKKQEKLGKGDITPFQAFSTAAAATMGVGNLVGTTTAILFGGPGAVFWMWMVGFFGITTKFAEIVLAVHYREVSKNGLIIGGPMKYIEKGLGWKWLAVIFCIAGSIAAFGIGNLVQANNVAGAMERAFNVPRPVSGIALMILVGLVIIGGIKRVGKVAERAVPFMAIAMVIGCALVAIQNITLIPEAFSRIFVGAFTTQGAVGGFAGAAIASAIRYGLMRGIFSNEAGLGSAPIAHATAETNHPVRQGFWGAIEVLLDTHVVCTAVALAVLTSGAWTQGQTAMATFMYAFSSSFIGPVIGNAVAATGILIFAYTTMLGWSVYGEKCLEYLVGPKSNMVYRALFLPSLYVGSFGVVPVWAIADILNAFMAVPNIIAVIALTGPFAAITKSYFAGERYVPYDENPTYYKQK
ncbi:MAG: sodium:alanine symporter family protein [Selenomonadales bacterium]|jgi:AGCS family alanine or glycine:cation symporter|nr:sodium:alanine symporter family protein [Selenomonadales bacterium]